MRPSQSGPRAKSPTPVIGKFYYISQVVASFSFNMSGGRLAFLTSVSSASEYKSKPARNVHLSKIKGIISLKQKKSNFTTKMFGVQSHKKTVSTGIAYRF